MGFWIFSQITSSLSCWRCSTRLRLRSPPLHPRAPPTWKNLPVHWVDELERLETTGPPQPEGSGSSSSSGGPTGFSPVTAPAPPGSEQHAAMTTACRDQINGLGAAEVEMGQSAEPHGGSSTLL